MKIKYTGTEPNLDTSLDIVQELADNGIITDRDSQVQGIYDNEIILENVTPSDKLTEIVNSHPDYQLVTDPNSTDAFAPEEGLADIDKVGTVPDPVYHTKDEDDDSSIADIELFPETELVDTESEDQDVDRNKRNFNSTTMRKNKNFNDPTLDSEGVSIEGKRPEIEERAEEDKSTENPGDGSFGVDATPFTDEEIEAANDVHVELDGNQDVEVFSDDEIEDMTDPDEVEKIAEDMEKSQKEFSDRKKRLYSAKRRLHKINSKVADRKSFAEELTEKEQSDVIDDIVAILDDAPEIKESVLEEVESSRDSEADEPEEPTVDDTDKDEVKEAPKDDTEDKEPEHVVEAEADDDETKPEDKVKDDEKSKSEDEDEDDDTSDIDAFSDDEIENAPSSEDTPDSENVPESDDEDDNESEDESEDDEDKDEEDEEEFCERASKAFTKAFCEDSTKSFRHSMLEEMSKKSSIRR